MDTKRTLRQVASDIASPHFESWYQKELTDKAFNYHDSLSSSEVEELCALRWDEARTYEEVEVFTESYESKDIFRLGVLCAKGDLDAIYQLPRLIQKACIGYYTPDIEELLEDLFNEWKSVEGLTKSNYERGMENAGHTESDFG